MTFEVIDPASGEVVTSYDAHGGDEIERRLARSWSAFTDWRRTPYERRSELLLAAADVLEKRRDEFALLMTTEMGKPITAAEAEVEKCAWVCRYEAEHGPGHLAQDVVPTDAGSEADPVLRPRSQDGSRGVFEGETVIADPSEELLKQSATDPEESHFRQIYADFL